MMDHNKLFGTMRALLNRPSWQAQEEQQFKRLIMSLSKTAPKIYQSVWQPYLQGQKQRWKHTVLTATSIEEVDLLYWSLPWVSWQYQLSPNYITPLSTSLDRLQAHPYHTKLVGLDFSRTCFCNRQQTNQLGYVVQHALFQQIHRLGFNGCMFTVAHLELLLSGELRHLEYLDLSRNAIQDLKASLIGEADLSGLKTLKLNDNGINNRAAYWLAQAPYLYNLERLELKNNRINGKGKRWLSESLVFPNKINIVH